jgi:hypothetical protein
MGTAISQTVVFVCPCFALGVEKVSLAALLPHRALNTVTRGHPLTWFLCPC